MYTHSPTCTGCRDSSCDNTLHINDINMFYNDICNCLFRASQGAAAELMRSSRLNFKYILRQCQSNEEMIRADAMARSLTDKDSVSFWKQLCAQN